MIKLLWMLLALEMADFADAGSAFSYDEKTWPAMCHEDKRQSPIDIVTSDVVLDGALEPLQFQLSSESMVDISAPGTTIGIAVSDSSLVRIGNTHHYLRQIHFHWSLDENNGTEHAFDGVRTAAEMHLIFSTTRDRLSSIVHNGSLTVVGVLFEVGESERTTLAEAMKTFLKDGKSKKRNKKRPPPPPPKRRKMPTKLEMDLTQLVPKSVDSYYTYDGSLTTPDCNPIVTWILLSEIQPITAKELALLRKTPGMDGSPVTWNVRSLQALNGRTVRSRGPSKSAAYFSVFTSVIILAALLFALILVATIIVIRRHRSSKARPVSATPECSESAPLNDNRE